MVADRDCLKTNGRMSLVIVGIAISLVGQSTSGLGFNFQRYAHIMNSQQPLLRRWPWILGMVCLSFCEVMNFVAVSFAPVSVIAPLGSFSIMATALFGSLFFHEPVTLSAVSAIAYITFGVFLMVVNGPSPTRDLSVEEFALLWKNGWVIVYFASLLFVMVLLGIFAHNNLYGVIGLASLGASNSVMLSKALSTFVKMSITVSNQLTNVLPYGIALVMAACIVMQVNCVNRALEQEKSYVVNALYFVMLATMSVINATVLYGELMVVTHIGKLLFAAGAISVVNGVFQLTTNRKKDTVDDERVSLLTHRASNADLEPL
jgi:multidrug transporter EmrE-like cation transporter